MKEPIIIFRSTKYKKFASTMRLKHVKIEDTFMVEFFMRTIRLDFIGK